MVRESSRRAGVRVCGASLSPCASLCCLSQKKYDVTFTRTRSRTDIRKDCTKIFIALHVKLNLGMGCTILACPQAGLLKKERYFDLFAV